jgi:hypothetical protein
MKCNGRDCKVSAKFEIIYNAGKGSKQKLTLCSKHYNSDPVFKLNIKSLKDILK